ncbi:MaoC/PaaZ C-terminal domain-containing protein [Pseudomonas sp. NFACC07-1]|uniref:MaoC/PaaZ C-terminal domain-containing protein n=1 Tax=Pseudomonas sp. NFACC07-1 TaxID=1566239 RepID=UPI0008CD50FE|nr:MaoC/PaaZ C-terminal domain-containing protein [Pseudomonas sp. NFACC07-1]SEI53659.1 Acyl dehydratase [Pseudomonas sp. NFACC07-1]
MDIYFDDVEVGYTEQAGPYYLDKQEIIDFATRYDPERFHTDEAFASASLYKGLTASSSHLIAIAYALSHRRQNRMSILAPLGMDEMRFPNPARAGDELHYSMSILEKTESKSKPDRGILRVKIVITNGKGEPVLDYVHTLLVARRR